MYCNIIVCLELWMSFHGCLTWEDTCVLLCVLVVQMYRLGIYEFLMCYINENGTCTVLVKWFSGNVIIAQLLLLIHFKYA